VHSAELGHRVVAILKEDLLVQLVSTIEADGGINGKVPFEVEVTDKFVKKKSTQTLGRT
jgi:hypothetical protein